MEYENKRKQIHPITESMIFFSEQLVAHLNSEGQQKLKEIIHLSQPGVLKRKPLEVG